MYPINLGVSINTLPFFRFPELPLFSLQLFLLFLDFKPTSFCIRTENRNFWMEFYWGAFSLFFLPLVLFLETKGGIYLAAKSELPGGCRGTLIFGRDLAGGLRSPSEFRVLAFFREMCQLWQVLHFLRF